MMNFPSRLIEEAVSAFASLPGIGKKTALRLTLHLLNGDSESVKQFTAAINSMKEKVRFCSICHNVCDEATGETEEILCQICTNLSRKKESVCVVENLRDLIAIENTNQFNGRYHVLGGVISPVDGIGPDQLNIGTLVSRIEKEGIVELIMALNPTIEGDTTIFYLSKKINMEKTRITTIARGISFGGELEYVDEMTLSRSLANRLPFDNYLVNK